MKLAAHFHRHIERTSDYALAALQRDAPGLPPTADQEILFNTVQQGISLPATWPYVRQVLLALAPRIEQSALYPSWTRLLEAGLAAVSAR